MLTYATREFRLIGCINSSYDQPIWTERSTVLETFNGILIKGPLVVSIRRSGKPDTLMVANPGPTPKNAFKMYCGNPDQFPIAPTGEEVPVVGGTQIIVEDPGPGAIGC